MSRPMTRRSSTTLRTLLRSGTALLILTVVTGWFAWSSFTRAHDTVERVGDRTVPAILDVAAARAALTQADYAAMRSFQTGAANFAGPGEEYRSQLAIATQSLTRAAENNVTQDEGSQSIRVVQGLLASYTSSIEQAATLYRENPDAELWLVDLWTARQVLHGGVHQQAPGGVLGELEALQERQLVTLDEEVDGHFGGPASQLSWLIPATLLAGLLGGTQVFLTYRFRRRVNPGLLGAALVLIGVIAVTALTFPAHASLDDVRSRVRQTNEDSQGQADQTRQAGQRILAEQIGTRCTSACGHTVDVFLTRHADPATPAEASPAEVGQGSEAIDEASGEAGRYRGVAFLIPLGTVLVLGSVAAGLYSHIDRYRYRAR